VAKVGSANERPGITGVSHLFEHMMFKGTHTLGTKDIEQDLAIIRQLDEVKAGLREEEQDLIRRYRLGEIADPKDPAARSERHRELQQQFDKLIESQRELLIKNDFDQIYTEAGGSGQNAGTMQDLTVYFINVPANKLELWFWMESDRLSNPVFREFYSERDVVHEERRLRTDSTPTGKFQEQFESMFWTSHPYHWPVVGWPSDLDGLTREEAQAYFDLNYAPNNIAACLVGEFDPEEAKRLADKYFSRLERNRDPEPVRTREIDQQAEKRMTAYAETNPEVEIRYHTVADGHVDEPALVVLGALLSGQTGRLHKSLVLEQQVANSAGGGQSGYKWAGYFSLSGVAKPGRTPEEVEQAIYKELQKIMDEKIGDRELQKVKNRFNANNFRRIQSNFFLLIQLLMAEGYRGWVNFNEDPKRIQAVAAEDVQRVAEKYLKPERRAVAVYYTKEGESAEAEDPDLEGLTPEQKAGVQQVKGMLPRLSVEQLRQMLGQMEERAAGVPEDQQAVMELVKKLVLERLQELEGGQK
jgi:predicted Zn-dependent peptidase